MEIIEPDVENEGGKEHNFLDLQFSEGRKSSMFRIPARSMMGKDFDN